MTTKTVVASDGSGASRRTLYRHTERRPRSVWARLAGDRAFAQAAAGALLAAGVVSTVQAGDIVYDNGPADPAVGSPAAQLDPEYPFYAAAADDFIFSSIDFPGANTMTVTGFNWAGVTFSPGGEPIVSDYRILIWPDAGGVPAGGTLPGSPPDESQALHIFEIPGDANQTPTADPNRFTYSLKLPTPIELEKDTIYWLQIQPVTVFPPQFAWAASATPGNAVQGFDLLRLAFWTPLSTPADLSFQIQGLKTPGPMTIFVDDDNCPGPGDGSRGNPYCSIQTAIDAAVDADEVIVAPGLYFESISMASQITVRSSDGPDSTTIIGIGGTVVDIQGGPATVDGFTITGGNAEQGGGGMICSGSSTITNCTIIDNIATTSGGGMLIFGPGSTVDNCRFENNSSGVRGGGLAITSVATVTNCHFENNSAAESDAVHVNVGATFVSCTFRNHPTLNAAIKLNVNSSASFLDCELSGNTLPIWVFGGSAVLDSCTISENQVLGGAIVEGGTMSLTNCTIADNECLPAAPYAGGLTSVNFGELLVTQCVMSGNVSANTGGAAAVQQGGSGVFTNCTIFGNSSAAGVGGLDEPTLVQNCIVWGNEGDQILESVDTVVAYSDVQGGFAGTGNIDADPLFVDPGSGDYRLSAGSPCIDAANNSAMPNDVDLDGNPRFINDLDTPDTGSGSCPIVEMGPYEYQNGELVCCIWDLSGDGNVGTEDLLGLLANWGTNPGGPPDFDGDGNVGTSDLLKLLSNWGPCP